MNKILCGVENCSHNKSASCYADRVNIGGRVSQDNVETCCGSFMNRTLYSDLTSNVTNGGDCPCLVCHVKSCAHNESCLCTLNQIEINGLNSQTVQMYTETNCKSFDRK